MTSPLDNDGRAEPLAAPVGGEQASGNDKPLDDEQFLIELVEEPGLDERQESQPATSDSHDPPELPAFLRQPWMPALTPHDLQTGGYHPEKVYGVTRRFSLATVMLMMAGASILLAVMNAFNVSPFISGTLIVLCFATALGQMFLFGGNDPRRASIVVGAAFCTLAPLLLGIVLGVRIFGSRDRAMEILISLLLGLPLGAMAGYVAGCVVAGVLLMMDLTESKLERWRKAREPDDDPWPPPKSPAMNLPPTEHPQ